MTLRPSPRRLRRTHTHRPVPGVINGVPAAVDLLRADLYRMIDQIAHARAGGHHALLLQFERTWEQFKDAIRRRG
jgi:hypothetical protein